MKGLLTTTISAGVAPALLAGSTRAEPLPTQRYLPPSVAIGKQTVGAIGGSAGPVNDELCAKAGIDKIKDRLAPQ